MIRQGTVFKLLVDLDPKGRMARLLVRLPDPLCLEGEDAAEKVEGACESQDKVLLGSFVRVRIDAGQLEKVLFFPKRPCARAVASGWSMRTAFSLSGRRGCFGGGWMRFWWMRRSPRMSG